MQNEKPCREDYNLKDKKYGIGTVERQENAAQGMTVLRASNPTGNQSPLQTIIPGATAENEKR